MSFSPILPDLSDDEIMAICCSMFDYANGDTPDPDSGLCRPRNRHRFVADLAYADEVTDLADRSGVDIQALMQRVLNWNDAEFAGAQNMVVLFWQPRGLTVGRDEIRAELSPTAHERLFHARCLYAFRARRQPRASGHDA